MCKDKHYGARLQGSEIHKLVAFLSGNDKQYGDSVCFSQVAGENIAGDKEISALNSIFVNQTKIYFT